MPIVERTALVPHTAQEMYDLVNDVAAYPDFLPWCGGSEVHSYDDIHMKASVDIEKLGLKKTFTTYNNLKPGREIEITLVDGPFKNLHGFWDFDPLSDTACKVSLTLEYDFDSSIMEMTVGMVFNPIANAMLDAFCQRAREVCK